MIFSENEKPELIEFQSLMKETDKMLNSEAKKRESYFSKRTGLELEKDVFEVLCECSRGTKFENSINLVSGASFPDIVANRFYGIEVKSTEKNHWTSTGSSILESTRNIDVERIYMTFGKLGKPVEFLSKPYEDCLSEISVTHYPRYRIDMKISQKETIFSKMGTTYDELRKDPNAIKKISDYYKSKLKPGESLWWASSSEINESVPFTVKLFSSLEKDEKNLLIAQMLALFPCLFSQQASKYDKPIFWLLTTKGVINTHMRDSFSAGGKVDMKTKDGIWIPMPAIFDKVERFKKEIRNYILSASSELLSDSWNTVIEKDRITQWINLCSNYYGSNQDFPAKNILETIFQLYQINDNYFMQIADNESSF